MSIHLVPDGLDGDRIDAAAARMTGLSRSRVAELVEAGAVQLDGVVVEKPSLRVRAGAMLEVELDAIPSGVQVTAEFAKAHDLADLAEYVQQDWLNDPDEAAEEWRNSTFFAGVPAPTASVDDLAAYIRS